MKKELQASQRLVLAVVLDAAVDHSEFGLFPHASKAANHWMKSDLVSRLECCQEYATSLCRYEAFVIQ